MTASFHIFKRNSIGSFGKMVNLWRSTPVMEGFAVEDDASCVFDEHASGALGVDMLMEYDPLLLLLYFKEL